MGKKGWHENIFNCVTVMWKWSTIKTFPQKLSITLVLRHPSAVEWQSDRKTTMVSVWPLKYFTFSLFLSVKLVKRWHQFKTPNSSDKKQTLQSLQILLLGFSSWPSSFELHHQDVQTWYWNAWRCPFSPNTPTLCLHDAAQVSKHFQSYIHLNNRTKLNADIA